MDSSLIRDRDDGRFAWRMGIISSMFSLRLRRIIGIVILLVSLALLLWGIWPLEEAVRSVPVLPANMQLPEPTGWMGLFYPL